MPSFQIALSPHKRAAGRFVLAVRRTLQRAFAEEQRRSGITQSAIARELGVHRSVINRELRGDKDLTLSRVAELSYLLRRKPSFSLPERTVPEGNNIGQKAATTWSAPILPPPVPSTAPSTADGNRGKIEFLMAAE